MAIKLTYGLEGVRQSDYRVYVAGKSVAAEINSDISGIADRLQSIAANNDEFNVDVVDKLQLILEDCQHIGEFRRDSIELGGEDGTNIEGNEVGEISLSKECNFAAELINTTQENIDVLEEMSQHPAIFILEEIKGSAGSIKTKNYTAYEYEDMRRFIVIANIGALPGSNIGVKFNLSEKNVGGDVPRATISVSRNTGRVSNFRMYRDIIMDAGVFGEFEEGFEEPAFVFDGSDELILNDLNDKVENIDSGFDDNDLEFDFKKSGLSANNIVSISAENQSGHFWIRIKLDKDVPVEDRKIIRVRIKPTGTLDGSHSMWLPFKIIVP